VKQHNLLLEVAIIVAVLSIILVGVVISVKRPIQWI